MRKESGSNLHTIAGHAFLASWFTALCSLPLLRFGSALDAHWTTAWPALVALVILGLSTRMLVVSTKFLWILTSFLVLTAVQYYVGRESYNEDILLLISFLLLLSLQPTVTLINHRTTLIAVPVLWCIYSLLLIALLIQNTLTQGYSHESTYAVKPLFAHRNIAIESYTLWSVAAFAILGLRRWRWLLLAITAAVVVVYQVRTALIGVALFIVIEFIRNFSQFRWFKWLLAVGCVMLIAMQLTFSFLRTPNQKHRFDALPDLVKNLDLSYNLTRAESSSERLIMWQWTTDHANSLGNGTGSWKFLAEGYINSALGKCELMVRHPHSDLLKMTFEIGVIFTVIFLLWWIVSLKSSLRHVVVFLPMYVFAFPTERGETLSALMVLIICTSNPKQAQEAIGFKMSLALTTALLIAALAWSRSQHCLGKAMRDPLVLKQTSPIDRKMLDAFPFDIVLNRLPTYQAIVLADASETAAARQLLGDVLKKHPNDQGAIRLLQRLGGQLPSNAVVCDSLTARP